jgi:hypothetical protein
VTKLERGASPPCDDLANPTRPRYLEGRLITAADLTQEQEYHRTKRRRHNLLLHGTGLVSGLDVAVESGSTGEPVVSVSPGVAISPDGEELLVCERMMSPVTVATPLAYVALRLADRPHAMIPTSGGDEASRIEEVVEVHVVTELATSDLGIARVVRREDSWRVDPTFNVPRGAAR